MSLFNKVKDELRILDNDNDDIIQDLILRAKANLNEIAGVELDYEVAGLAQTLLLNYCRYDFNNALEYFEENFYKELNRLIFSVAVKKHEENKAETT